MCVRVSCAVVKRPTLIDINAERNWTGARMIPTYGSPTYTAYHIQPYSDHFVLAADKALH